MDMESKLEEALGMIESVLTEDSDIATLIYAMDIIEEVLDEIRADKGTKVDE